MFDPRYASQVHQFYSPVRFRVAKKYIGFSEVLSSGSSHPPNVFKIFGIEWLVNRFQRIYERFFAFSVPASEVYFELQVLKDSKER